MSEEESRTHARGSRECGPDDVERPRFLVDEMLGRLGRWLRVLGYDAEDAAGRDDDVLLEVAEEEGRLLLTRDTRLVRRRPVNQGRVRAFLVCHDHVGAQLRQLRDELGIRRVGAPRCLVCNGRLLPISRQRAEGRVPSYVHETHTDFRYCPTCDRVVWPGTHWREMETVLRDHGII